MDGKEKERESIAEEIRAEKESILGVDDEKSKMGDQQAAEKDKKGDKEDGDDKEDEDESTTSTIFGKVVAFLAFDEIEMGKDVHLVDDAIALRKDITGQMAPLLFAELAPAKQMKRLVGIMQHMWGVYWEQFKVMGIGKARIKLLFVIKQKFACFQNFGGRYSLYT